MICINFGTLKDNKLENSLFLGVPVLKHITVCGSSIHNSKIFDEHSRDHHCLSKKNVLQFTMQSLLNTFLEFINFSDFNIIYSGVYF